VVLWLVGSTIAESGGTPGDDATGADVLAYFEEHSTSILIGRWMFGLGCLAFILLLGMLRSRLTAADGGDRGPATFVFGAGLVAAVMIVAAQVPGMSLAIQTGDSANAVEPVTAQTLWFAGDGFFIMGALTAALFLFAVAAVILRTSAVAKWIAWLGVAIGIVMLIPPIGWAGLVFGLPLWILVTSVALILHRVELPSVHRAAPAH
jgi:hypothetical protein